MPDISVLYSQPSDYNIEKEGRQGNFPEKRKLILRKEPNSRKVLVLAFKQATDKYCPLDQLGRSYKLYNDKVLRHVTVHLDSRMFRQETPILS